MKIKIHELLSLPLAALLLSTAFAAEQEWKEVTDAGQLFGLGEYAADWDAQTQTLRLYTDEQGTLNEFRAIEHVLEQPQPALLENDAYFLIPRDGKYAIFSRDGEQLTAYRYNGVEFYGDVAVGTFSPDDMTLWDADLIDLKMKKVIASSGAGEPIGVSPDERSFTVGDTVYDADGNILFQTEVGNIVSPEVRETAQGVLWIGSRDGKNALYYDNTCVSGQYDDIQPYDIGDTQLFTASSDGTEALMDTDGREITKTTGDIMLLASGLAAVTDGNTVTYWNQGGRASLFEQYAAVQCFVGEKTDAFDRVLVQTKAGKWGVVRQDGTVLLENLDDGQYVVRETEALQGYAKTEDTLTFTIDESYVVPEEMPCLVNKKEDEKHDIQTGVDIELTPMMTEGAALLLLAGIILIGRRLADRKRRKK